MSVWMSSYVSDCYCCFSSY